MQQMRHTLLVLVALLSGAALASCSNDTATGAPDAGEMFTRFELLQGGPGSDRLTEVALEDAVVRVIDEAQFDVVAAFEHLESERIAQALIRARDERGVRVRVVGDVDHKAQGGFVALAAADIDMKLGDGPLTYNIDPVTGITRQGDHNRMTHNFVVADERVVLNLSGGFWGEEVHQLGFRIESEDIGKDYADEFHQMHAGVFSTTLSAFNGPLKSITNNRYFYPSDAGALQVFYGPQERLTKRIIDEIYAARSSVFIITEEFSNEFIDEALRYKAMNGFDVGLVVDSEGALADNSKVNAVARDLNGIRSGGDVLPSLRVHPDVRQTVVILDSQASPINGKRYTTKVMVLSQPLVASLSFESNGRPVARPSDAFMDGSMWMLERTPNATHPKQAETINAMIENFQTLFNSADEVTP